MARSIFNAVGTDDAKETSGVWIAYNTGGDDYFFRCARAGGKNVAFLTKLEQMTRPYRRANVDVAMLPQLKQDEIQRVIYAETIILEWGYKGADDDITSPDMVGDDATAGPRRFPWLPGENDDKIACTRDNIIAVFKGVPDLLRFLQAEAANYQNFRIASRKEEAGN